MPNKSLDASGISGFLIDNLCVTWLTAAASTQPLGALSSRPTTYPRELEKQIGLQERGGTRA
jgi:hypothetical protein